jgi:predicted DNA-binding WGR domain protein
MVQVVVFIGTLTLSTRETHIAKANKNGYKVEETITKSTTFLICGKDGEQTIINKAKNFGIRIISEQKWVEILHKTETSETGKKRTRSDNKSQKKLVYLESRQYRRFWQMRRVYKTTYIRTGSIGTKGMETSKEHETKKLAKESMISLTAAKKTSGYKEANRPQSLDYEDSSDSSDDDFGDENNEYKYKQKKQKLENEGFESDATLRGDETSDVDNGAAALKEDEDEDLSTIKGSSLLPSFITNPKSSMSIMNGNTVDVLLAFPWKPDEIDPTGWWISEKLDGVRAFWNSKKGKFYSRNGNEFVPPSW